MPLCISCNLIKPGVVRHCGWVDILICPGLNTSQLFFFGGGVIVGRERFASLFVNLLGEITA